MQNNSVEVPQALYEDSKAYLLKTDEYGGSLYDHLSGMVARLIEGKPTTVSNFEEYSRQVKSDEFRPREANPNRFWHKNKPDERCVKRANEINNLFKVRLEGEPRNVP